MESGKDLKQDDRDIQIMELTGLLSEKDAIIKEREEQIAKLKEQSQLNFKWWQDEQAKCKQLQEAMKALRTTVMCVIDASMKE